MGYDESSGWDAQCCWGRKGTVPNDGDTGQTSKAHEAVNSPSLTFCPFPVSESTAAFGMGSMTTRYSSRGGKRFITGSDLLLGVFAKHTRRASRTFQRQSRPRGKYPVHRMGERYVQQTRPPFNPRGHSGALLSLGGAVTFHNTIFCVAGVNSKSIPSSLALLFQSSLDDR